MQTIRIFISSPGDVSDERNQATQVIENLQREFRDVRLEVIKWEDLPLPATAAFQDGIEVVLARHPIDIAIFIVWSRLGTPLGPTIVRESGDAYRSGTEREFDLMLSAFDQSGKVRPTILAYMRRDDRGFQKRLEGRSIDDLEELISQRKLADHFIKENFRDTEGRNLRAYRSYSEPVGFAQSLHNHLRQILDEKLGSSGHSIWREAPYRGLDAFEVGHAPIFCGREEEICDILQRFRDREREGCASVVLIGASGAGKSSLAKAGVAAMLADYPYETDVKEWRIVHFVPGHGRGRLLDRLIECLADQVPELQVSDTPLSDLAKGFCQDPTLTARLALTPALKRESAKIGGPVKVLCLVDQLEELWTDNRFSEQDRNEFLAALAALARSPQVAVLSTLRSDYYPIAQRYPSFIALKSGIGHVDVLPLETGALQLAIESPARLAGLTFEHDEATGRSLSQIMLSDAAKCPGALPLIQFTLMELYERRDRLNQSLTLAAYDELGGIAGALESRTAAITRVHTPSAMEELFPFLVGVDPDSGGTARIRCTLQQLADSPEREVVVNALIDARLLTADQEGGIAQVSIAHESLLSNWKLLADWIDSNRDLLRRRGRVEQMRVHWESLHRDESLLLAEGLPLEEGKALLAPAAKRLLGHQTADYIRRSVELRQRMRQDRERSRRQTLSAMLFLTLLASGFAAFAEYGRRHIQQESARVIAQHRLMKDYGIAATTDIDGLNLHTTGYRLEAITDQAWPQIMQLAGTLKRVSGFKLENCDNLHRIDRLENVPELRRFAIDSSFGLAELDVSPLQSLTVLEITNCGNLTKVTLGQPLANDCHALKTLDLHGSGVRVTNQWILTTFPHMANLEFLDLSYHNGFTTLKGLCSCHKLQRLFLEHCECLTDIDDVSCLSHLEELRISGSMQVAAFPDLSDCRKLSLVKTGTGQFAQPIAALKEVLPDLYHEEDLRPEPSRNAPPEITGVPPSTNGSPPCANPEL